MIGVDDAGFEGGGGCPLARYSSLLERFTVTKRYSISRTEPVHFTAQTDRIICVRIIDILRIRVRFLLNPVSRRISLFFFFRLDDIGSAWFRSFSLTLCSDCPKPTKFNPTMTPMRSFTSACHYRCKIKGRSDAENLHRLAGSSGWFLPPV